VQGSHDNCHKGEARNSTKGKARQDQKESKARPKGDQSQIKPRPKQDQGETNTNTRQDQRPIRSFNPFQSPTQMHSPYPQHHTHQLKASSYFHQALAASSLSFTRQLQRYQLGLYHLLGSTESPRGNQRQGCGNMAVPRLGTDILFSFKIKLATSTGT
jgi:hypothetical protein